MKKIIPFLLVLGYTASAQIQLPQGYSVQKNMDGKANEIRTDFNADGKQDVIAVITKGEDVKLFAAISSSKGSYTYSTHKSMEYFDCCSRMEQKGNIVKIHSNGMRYFENYTLRYNKTSFGFDVIGFDSESFGNAINDGAGTKSINLLTGDFESSINQVPSGQPEKGKVVKQKKKLRVPKKYTLKNFNEAMDFIADAVSD
jgi:hypothetical protein